MRPLVLVLLVLLHGEGIAFAPFLRHERAFHATTCLHMAKRSKLSAKEKRKRRAKQLQPRPVTGKPVNFDKPAVNEQQESTPAQETSTSDGDNAPPTERAKQLLEAQRKSVDMLTHVRERVEALDYGEIQSSLSEKGYAVVDDFVRRDDIINELQQEGLALFQKEDMEVDLTNVGSGEYLCKIEGGEEQYKVCPRTVEFVVSVTKHMAPSFVGSNLDPSACMATMRTYDKKAQEASLELLSGALTQRPLDVVANEDQDARKISVLYYPKDGSGVSFENEKTISGKRDRLLLLKSDTCLHRKESWSGDEVNASCIELHLIQG